VTDRDKISFADEQMGFAECAFAVELRGARDDERLRHIVRSWAA
jgi:hypothetical protein